MIAADDHEHHRYRIAVWIVIASEAMLFAGLFALYAAYRSEHLAAFDAGVRADDQLIGGTNTFVLLTSSFAMASAVHAARGGRRRLTQLLLAGVLALGLVFLALKGYEWHEHVEEGVVPGSSLFATLYYGMTGLHALHVIAGLALVTWVLARDRRFATELVGLYWHFVDAVWVFLWPLFYLLRS